MVVRDRSTPVGELLATLAPRGDRRMGATPHANGGRLLQPLDVPPFRDYAIAVPKPATVSRESTRQLGAMLRDVQAAIVELKKAGPVGIMGFCMGGTISFLAACKLNGLSAAVCYYGGQIAKNADEKPKVPVQMHFGETDASIPMTDVDAVRAAQPKVESYVYKGAGHGFGCDERGSYSKPDYDLAQQRTLDFFAKNLG